MYKRSLNFTTTINPYNTTASVTASSLMITKLLCRHFSIKTQPSSPLLIRQCGNSSLVSNKKSSSSFKILNSQSMCCSDSCGPIMIQRTFFFKKKKESQHLPIETTPYDKWGKERKQARIVDDGSFKALFLIAFQNLRNIKRILTPFEIAIIGLGIISTLTVAYRYLKIV